MKIAILYTGELRTVEKTIEYFKQNILLTSDVHVFAVVQSEYESKYEKFLHTQMKSHLKSLKWFRKKDTLWIELREYLLIQIANTVDDNYKNYLRKSGSMIEYYQLYLAYIQMYEYEKLTGEVYDYVVRMRPDVIITKMLCFDWIDWTVDSIKMKFSHIKFVNTDEKICWIMNSLIDSSRQHDIGNYTITISNDLLLTDLRKKYTDQKLIDYIKNGNYIITLRKNVLYIVKRKLFSPLSSLGYTYGLHLDEDPNWISAESQLIHILLENNITIFNSNTLCEHACILNYNKDEYFLENGSLRKRNDVFFFIRRF